MKLWEHLKSRQKLITAFKMSGIYKTVGAEERKIFPKIHSVKYADQSTEFIFTLPNGVNPDLIKKNFYVFQQIFGNQVEIEGEIKSFTLTVYKAKLSKELAYRYTEILPAIHGLKIPIVCGKDRHGAWVVYDAVTEPNCLISGEPGSGKSTQLRSILTTLIKYKSPDQLHMYLGDLKMSEFHLFKKVRHVKAIAVFPSELDVMLTQVYNEMLKRSQILNAAGVTHIDQLPDDKKVPYILLAIDEIVMVMDNKEIKKMIVQIDSLGRALGIYNILSLQRPSHDILDTKIRSLLTVRMGFRTTDFSNAKIIGTPGSEKISRETPGRFYLKRDTLDEIQAPFLNENDAKKSLEGYKTNGWVNAAVGCYVRSDEVLTEKDVFNDVN